MRVRTVLIVTAILSSILGAVVAYLVLTVPNDLQAAALMRSARKQIAGGDNERARQSLSRIVQQYPRTDAAAAATVALASLADSERKRLETDLSSVRNTAAAQQKQIVSLTLVMALAVGVPAAVIWYSTWLADAASRATFNWACSSSRFLGLVMHYRYPRSGVSASRAWA